MRKRPFLLLATEFLLGIVCVREQLPAWGVLAVLLLVYTTPWKERGMRKVLFAAGLPGYVSFGDAADAATDRFQAAVPAETHRWPGGSPGGKD